MKIIIVYFLSLQAAFNSPDTYYVFNHVDITLTYHSGRNEEWGATLGDVDAGRLISAKLEPKR